MEEDIALGKTLNLLSIRWNKLLRTLEFSKDPEEDYDWNILFGRRRETKIRKKTTECFIWQSYTGFHACEINVELIEKRIIHFEQSVWNNTIARFIIWLCSSYDRRKNFWNCRWTVRNIYLTHASNIRRARKSCMHTKKKLHTMVRCNKNMYISKSDLEQ